MNSKRCDTSGLAELPGDISEALREVHAELGTFGSPLSYFASIGSTNDEAARLAARGAAEGTTVIAESQTSGRGRLGRTWFSPPGAGLYLSVVMRPRSARGPQGIATHAGSPAGAPAQLPSLLTLMAGVALCDAVRETTGLPAEIKWPNDLVCGSRKLAGILAESGVSGDLAGFVVLGIGVNLRPVEYPREIAARATSIEEELGRRIDRGALIARILVNLAQCRAALDDGRADGVLDRWRRLAPGSVGAVVQWQGPDGLRRGTTAGLDQDGALLVRDGDRVERIVSGEITWERGTRGRGLGAGDQGLGARR